MAIHRAQAKSGRSRSIVVAKLRADGIRVTGFDGPDLIRVVKQAPAVAL